MDIIGLMYGGSQQQYETEKIELERQQHEISMLADKILMDFDRGELEAEQHEIISASA